MTQTTEQILAFNEYCKKVGMAANDTWAVSEGMPMFNAAWNAAIESYKAELLKEVGEPVAWRFTAPGITKLDSWPHGGKWHELFTSDQVAAAVLKAEQRIAELENDRDMWKRAFENGGTETMQKQLAASQLRETQLRDALQTYIDEHEECQDEDDWMAMMCSIEAHHVADEALALPADTSALDAYVAEKAKAAYIPVTIDYGDGPEDVAYGNEHQVRRLKKWLDKLFAQKEQIATLTRQRDLAVEALEWIASSLPQIGVERVWMLDHANKTLATIKGEVKE